MTTLVAYMTNGTEIGNDLISSKHYPMKNVTFGPKTHTHKEYNNQKRLSLTACGSRTNFKRVILNIPSPRKA